MYLHELPCRSFVGFVFFCKKELFLGQEPARFGLRIETKLPTLKIIVRFYLNQVGCRLAVLGNQYRRFFVLQFGEDLGGSAFQCGDKFRAHQSDTLAEIYSQFSLDSRERAPNPWPKRTVARAMAASR